MEIAALPSCEKSLFADAKVAIFYKTEFNVTVMADLIGHLADYQMPGRGRA